MKKIGMSLNLKARVILILLIAGVLIVSAVGAILIKTPSGTTAGSGWIDPTHIWCSNGNTYEATFANLQTACAIPNIEIKYPSANITFTAALDIASGVKLIGCGNGSIAFADPTLNADMVTIDSKKDVWIEGIVFNGNNYSRSQTDLNYSIIDITGTAAKPSENITITHCTLLHGQIKSMIDIQEHCNYNIISGNNIYKRMYKNWENVGYGGGIWISGHNNKVLDNNIRDTWACGIVIEVAHLVAGDSVSDTNIIDGNHISGVISVGIYMESGGKSGNSTIVNNIITDINSSAYWVSEGKWSRGILLNGNSTCSNNLIKGIDLHGITSMRGRNIISNNIIYNLRNESQGAFIYSSGGDIISNNVLGNTSNVIYKPKYGMYIRSLYGNDIVTGNTIIHTRDGIKFLTGTNYSIISNNIIIDTKDNGIYMAGTSGACQINGNCLSLGYIGIRVDTRNYSMISNNVIENFTYRAISLVGATNCSVTNNIMRHVEGGIYQTASAPASNCTFMGNMGIETQPKGARGLSLEGDNNTVIGNIFRDFSVGIYEGASANGNIIIGNQCSFCTTPFDKTGINTICVYNQGKVS